MERFWRVASAFGVTGWLQAAILVLISTIYPVLMSIIGSWSWWIAAPVGLVFSTYALKVFAAFRAAQAIRGVKTLDLQQLGRDCVTFQTDLLDFLAGRIDAAPKDLIRRASSKTSEEHFSEWAVAAQYHTQTRARVVQRYASRALALSHLTETAGIKPPNLWAFDANAAGIAVYFGAVGELLENGLLTEARSLDPEGYRRAMIHMD